MAMPHVRAWPLLSVHAAVGAAHPAYFGDLFTQQSTSPVPKQDTLAAVGAHEAWIACLAALRRKGKKPREQGTGRRRRRRRTRQRRATRQRKKRQGRERRRSREPYPCYSKVQCTTAKHH